MLKSGRKRSITGIYQGIVISLLLVLSGLSACSQSVRGRSNQHGIQVGAYYFDGWTGKTMHIKDKLVQGFPERKPVWGWQTSNLKTIEEQIDLAAEAGISFFSFCWYFGRDKANDKIVDNDPKNNALNVYMQASNKEKLGFNLMIANHEGYIFKESDWKNLCLYWIEIFKTPGYVKVEGSPLITFFSMASLKQTFGSVHKVNNAFLELKKLAKKEGLKDVIIAGNATTPAGIALADSCGIDILTAYNYHNDGLRNRSNREIVPIDSMQVKEKLTWNHVSKGRRNAYIPVVTLNWDKRPSEQPAVRRSPRFEGYSGKSVEQSVYAVKRWVSNNPDRVTKEKIVMLYAWNEYGEGAWLTPSEKLGNQLLEGFKAGLRKK